MATVQQQWRPSQKAGASSRKSEGRQQLHACCCCCCTRQSGHVVNNGTCVSHMLTLAFCQPPGIQSKTAYPCTFLVQAFLARVTQVNQQWGLSNNAIPLGCPAGPLPRIRSLVIMGKQLFSSQAQSTP